MEAAKAALRFLIVLSALPGLIPAAEPGDFDGDGRISIADVVGRVEGLPPVEGSMDGFEAIPFVPDCARAFGDSRRVEAGLATIEFLRRSVPDPMPHWINLIDFWNVPAAQAPLPPDPDVSVSIDPASASGGLDDRFDLTIRLHTEMTLKAFSLLIESPDRILRNPESWVTWNEVDGAVDLPNMNPGHDRPGLSPHAFLITGGRYVVHYGLYPPNEDYRPIEPGDHAIRMEARLPKGTPAGTYEVRILETSEILFMDDTPAAPQIGPPAEVTVANQVGSGWDEGVPPLQIDPWAKWVHGKIQFRLAGMDGVAPAEGEPVARGAQGQTVAFKVQWRTEVPLSKMGFRLEWDKDLLRCDSFDGNSLRNLFTDPEDGEVYPPYGQWNLVCESGWILPPNLHGKWAVNGSMSVGSEIVSKYKGRPLEYFKPLGEWRDLASVKVHLLCDAPVQDGRIPLRFRRSSVTDGNSPDVYFAPYESYYHCSSCGMVADWSYDIEYQDGFIEVLDDMTHCPEENLDPEVAFVLGTVSGMPGEEVEVPIEASTELPVSRLSLALESDPPGISAAGAAIDGWAPESAPEAGGPITLTFDRGEAVSNSVCDDPRDEGTCSYGIPRSASLLGEPDIDPGYTLLGMTPNPAVHYPGDDLVEIGRLRVLIPEDFEGTKILLKRATVGVHVDPFLVPRETGGERPQGFFPATRFVEGVIRVGAGWSHEFIRGDANLDTAVDLSDAITVLGALFLGSGPLGCEDAGDTDDSGKVDISDPIFLLGSLYLGTGTIPDPYPGCGPDPAPDPAACVEESCS